MQISPEFFKSYLKRYPAAHRAFKFAFGKAINHRRERDIQRYNQWLQSTQPNNDELSEQKTKAANLPYQPLISLTAPTYNTHEPHLRQMIESVMAQTYSNWELVIVDDASPDQHVREVIDEYVRKDKRIKRKFLKTNHHIAGATNEAIALATGDYIGLFDHDDLLMPNALYEVACAIGNNRDIDFLYTDEDKVTEDGIVHYSPHFKPSWNPDMLFSINYITHFAVMRASVLKQAGGLRGKYNGAQDWDLFLRLAQIIPDERIHHISKLLYSWRTHPNSTAQDLEAKPYVVEAQYNALKDNLGQIFQGKAVVSRDKTYPGQWEVHMQTDGDNIPQSISYITHDMTSASSDSYVRLTDGMTYRQLLEAATGEYLVILNGGVKQDGASWLNAMLGDAQRNDIGFVIAPYTHKTDAIKTMGSLLGTRTLELITSNKEGALTMHNFSTTRYNIGEAFRSPVAVIERKKLEQAIKNMDDFYDIGQASLLVRAAGYRNLYNPYVRMVK